MPGRYLQRFDELMLQDKHSARDEVNFEDHLIGNPIDILCINIEGPVEYPL